MSTENKKSSHRSYVSKEALKSQSQTKVALELSKLPMMAIPTKFPKGKITRHVQ